MSHYCGRCDDFDFIRESMRDPDMPMTRVLELASARMGCSPQTLKAHVNRCRRRRGEEMVWRKLTDSQVLAIRKMYSTGEYSQRKLGRLFGVAQSTITRCVSGERKVKCLT